jgi:hypothetical protein
MNIFQNAAFGWILRRIPDWGGQIALIYSVFLAMPPEHQATIGAILRGEGGGLTVSAYMGVAAWLYAQVMSYRATTRTQMVADGKVTVPVPQDKPVVRDAAQEVRRQPTVLERVTQNIGLGGSR